MEKIIKGIFIILITFLVILQGTIISNADNTQSDEENAVTKISLKVKKSKITPNSEIKVYIYLESTKTNRRNSSSRRKNRFWCR